MKYNIEKIARISPGGVMYLPKRWVEEVDKSKKLGILFSEDGQSIRLTDNDGKGLSVDITPSNRFVFHKLYRNFLDVKVGDYILMTFDKSTNHVVISKAKENDYLE